MFKPFDNGAHTMEQEWIVSDNAALRLNVVIMLLMQLADLFAHRRGQ